MDLAKNKDVVRRYLQAIDDRDAAGAAALIADDVDWWFVGKGKAVKADVEAIYPALFSLTNAMHFKIIDQIAEGDRVATLAEVTYHTKDGRTINNDIQLSCTIKNGKLQAVREFYDMSKPPLKLE
jgi:ketosteroid isomerase-like protein